MNEKIRETLVITQEEAAEVIKEISKIFRFGIDEQHKSGAVHRQVLEEEIGDFLAMVDLLVEQGVVSQSNLDAAKVAKIEKLRIWSNILN
jgi:NTP pyrophosphatase (non-canonical NTP hydrolase)